MQKIKSLNTIIILTMLAMIATMLDNATGKGGIMKIIALAMDVLLIVWCFFKTNTQYFFRQITPICLLAIIILTINTIITPYADGVSWLLKYIGYFVFFIYGKELGKEGYLLKGNKWGIIVMIIIPLLMVFLFDDTSIKNKFFPNSNSFVHWGICMSLAYFLFNNQTKKSLKVAFCIILAYIIVGTSLGIMVAIFLSIFIINYKKVNPIFLLTVPIIAILCIAYIDLPVFERFRDSFRVLQILSIDEILNPQNVNFYELSLEATSSGRTDNASFVWRILQWTTLFSTYISNLIYIPFGMGLEWSTDYTGLPPHNDYLKILVEYGIIFFLIIIIGYKKVYNVVKYNQAFYFILPIFIYHISENLLGNFPQNVFFYISLGYYYSLNHLKNESTIN